MNTESISQQLFTTLHGEEAISAACEGLLKSQIPHDVADVESSVDDIRISWSAFSQELDGVIEKISRAETASDIFVEKAWFLAACNEWEQVVSSTK